MRVIGGLTAGAKLGIAMVASLLVSGFAVTSQAIGATPSYDIYSGPNLTSRVVLSFDDCPNDLTQYTDVITWARNNNVGLVLAPLGQCIENFESTYGKNIAVLAREDGQYVIDHSYDHPDFTTLTAREIRWQVSHGAASRYVRPPYGSWNAVVEATLSDMAPPRLMWLWNVDTQDWTGKSESEVVAYVIDNAHANNTVLMHMQWNAFNVPALKSMLSGLNQEGLSVCRAYHGGHPTGPVMRTPTWFRTLPC